jgi:hypothetical protein
MRYLLALPALFLIACQATTPAQTYRPASDSTAWQISAANDNGPFGDTITVMIDGKKVTTTAISLMTPSASSTGQHKGIPVMLECGYKTDLWSGEMTPKCSVIVESERAAIISF